MLAFPETTDRFELVFYEDLMRNLACVFERRHEDLEPERPPTEETTDGAEIAGKAVRLRSMNPENLSILIRESVEEVESVIGACGRWGMRVRHARPVLLDVLRAEHVLRRGRHPLLDGGVRRRPASYYQNGGGGRVE